MLLLYSAGIVVVVIQRVLDADVGDEGAAVMDRAAAMVVAAAHVGGDEKSGTQEEELEVSAAAGETHPRGRRAKRNFNRRQNLQKMAPK